MANSSTKTIKIPITPPSDKSPPRPLHQPQYSSASRPATILDKPMSDVTSYYVLDKELDRGQFDITYLCTVKATGLNFACKSISKNKLTRRGDREIVKREILMMQHLSGQPNIVKLKATFEDQQNIHLIMELCSGGTLSDRITLKGSYPERAAAAIGRAIVNVVCACHFMGVMHRDLKPESFLFSTRNEDALLKVTGFRHSVFIEEGKVYREIVGSPYYVAPEVLRKSYGKEIDVWSAGVILYTLLSGVPPFYAETEKGMHDAILQGQIDFRRVPWPSVSDAAKDLIKKMLTQDPKKRITAPQVLEHPWLIEAGEASDIPIASAVLSRMKQFGAMNKLKKLALMVIAEKLSKDKIKGFIQMFRIIDTDIRGSVMKS